MEIHFTINCRKSEYYDPIDRYLIQINDNWKKGQGNFCQFPYRIINFFDFSLRTKYLTENVRLPQF